MRKAAALKRPSALLRGNRRTALRFADPQSCDPNRHASLFHETKHTQTRVRPVTAAVSEHALAPCSGAIPVQGHARRPYEHTRRTSTRSAPPWSGRRPSTARAPSQNNLPLQHKRSPSRHDGRPRTPPRPCWRAGRPRTGHAPVPARALSWDTGSAALERTASPHGAPPYQNKMLCQHNPVHVLGRRACQDTPSSVLERGASQDGRSPVPARNRVLGHRGAVLERSATWNAPPAVPERRAVPAWVRGVPGRGGQSANEHIRLRAP